MIEDSSDKGPSLIPGSSDPLQRATDQGLISRGLDFVRRKRERAIEFAPDRSVGNLRLTAREDSPWAGWSAEAPACGIVRVPAGMNLSLEVDVSRVTDLSPFGLIKAGDVQNVVLRGPWPYLDQEQLVHLLDLVFRDPEITLDLRLSLQSVPARRFPHIHPLFDRCRSVHLEAATDEVMATVERLPHLRRLYLDWTSNKVTDEGVKHLAGLTSLEELALDYTRVTDSGAHFLLNLTSLRSLSLNRTLVGDQAMSLIGKLFSLRELNLSETKVTDTGLNRLSDVLPCLTWFSVWGTGVTDTGMPCLARAEKLVDHLGLGELPITDEGLRHLRGLHALRDLRLCGTRITDSGLESLRELAALEVLYLSDTTVTDEGIQVLGGHRRLRILDVKGTRVTSRGLQSLRDVLPMCERPSPFSRR